MKKLALLSLTILMAPALGAFVGCGEDTGIIKPSPLPTQPTPVASRPTAEDAGAVTVPPPATAPAEADPAWTDPDWTDSAWPAAVIPAAVIQDTTVAPCPKRPVASAPAGEPWAEPQIFDEQSEKWSWNFSEDIKFDAIKWFFEKISDAQAVSPASYPDGVPVDSVPVHQEEMNNIDRPLSADPVAEIPASLPVVETPGPDPVAERPALPPVAEAPAPAAVAETPLIPPFTEMPAPAPVVEVPPPPAVAEAPAPAPVAEAPALAPVEETPALPPVVEAPAPPPVADEPAPPSESAPEIRVVAGPEIPLQVYQEETVEDIRVSFSGRGGGAVIDHRHKDLYLTFCPTLQFDDPQCMGFTFNPPTDGDGNLVRNGIEGYEWETGTLVNETGNNLSGDIRSGDIPLDRLRYFRLSLKTTELAAVSIPGIRVEALVAGEWRPLYFNPYLRDSARPARDLIFGPDDTAVVFTVTTGSDLGAGTDDDVRLFFPKTTLDPELELYHQSQDLARPHFEILEESISMYLDWPETDDFEASQSGTYSAYFFNGDPIERQFFIKKSKDDENGDWQIRLYHLIVFKPGDPLFFETERCHVIGSGPFNDVWLQDETLRHPWRGWEAIPEGPCSPLTKELHDNWPLGPAVEN